MIIQHCGSTVHNCGRLWLQLFIFSRGETPLLKQARPSSAIASMRALPGEELHCHICNCCFKTPRQQHQSYWLSAKSLLKSICFLFLEVVCECMITLNSNLCYRVTAGFSGFSCIAVRFILLVSWGMTILAYKTLGEQAGPSGASSKPKR